MKDKSEDFESYEGEEFESYEGEDFESYEGEDFESYETSQQVQVPKGFNLMRKQDVDSFRGLLIYAIIA